MAHHKVMQQNKTKSEEGEPGGDEVKNREKLQVFAIFSESVLHGQSVVES